MLSELQGSKHIRPLDGRAPSVASSIASYEPQEADNGLVLLAKMLKRLVNGIALAGSERTPAASVVTASGTVAAGKKSVALIPSADFAGTILGVDVGTQPLTFEAPAGDTLAAIVYTRSAGSLTILTIA